MSSYPHSTQWSDYHQLMMNSISDYQSYHSPSSFTNMLQPPPNRFIYVKQNFETAALPHPQMPSKVLVNPHFKKKVYVNPQFHLQPKPLVSLQPTKIHINPNILKINQSQIKPLPKPLVVEEKKTTVVSTRNKLLRIPYTMTKINKSDIQNRASRKRRNSLHTKYKIIRSFNANTSLSSSLSNKVSSVIRSKFKLDKRIGVKCETPKAITVIGKHNKKRYVYIDRFSSTSIMAKNVLLKQYANSKKPGFVNINGILYKKSPNSLKKATDFIKKEHPSCSKYKIHRKKVVKSPVKSEEVRKSLVKRYKIIRTKKQSKICLNNLRKCNVPCQIYRKFGKCKGRENGTCIRVHNPDQIVLCTRFLQGACLDQNCLLSHKVSHEKMPTCKYFLEGLCSRDDCPYLHVKISPKADICKDFLEGFCKQGSQCHKRHQFLCPDFEKKQSCPRRKCPYPHGNKLVRKRKVSHSVAKKNSIKRKKTEVVAVSIDRYYGSDKKSEENDNVIETRRPKLGELPSFIPFENT